jgi:hypothetical protein
MRKVEKWQTKYRVTFGFCFNSINQKDMVAGLTQPFTPFSFQP